MNCRSCLSNKIVDIISLGDQYLSDFRSDKTKPPKYPLDLVLCESCKLVQLKETTPSRYLYTDNYGYESGINGLIREDLEEIVDTVSVMNPTANVVLDIGCNDGYLLSQYNDKITRVGFDPVPKFRKKAIKHADEVITDFFNAEKYKLYTDKKASIITSVSMFYDLDEPNQFVLDIEEILDDKGIWVCQQNYLGTMLTYTAYCNICHEHIEYYSLYSFEQLLSKFNLEVFKVSQNTINGGSFRTYICHKGAYPVDPSVQKMRDAEKRQKLHRVDTYAKFASNIKKQSQMLNQIVTNLNARGKTIYVYGASTRGNTLLQTSKLNNKLIQFAVERNPDKWGKKISSLQIPIISEDEARKHQPDYMLVLPWFLFAEFKEREADYINKGGAFILPLPEVKVIDKGNI